MRRRSIVVLFTRSEKRIAFERVKSRMFGLRTSKLPAIPACSRANSPASSMWTLNSSSAASLNISTSSSLRSAKTSTTSDSRLLNCPSVASIYRACCRRNNLLNHGCKAARVPSACLEIIAHRPSRSASSFFLTNTARQSARLFRLPHLLSEQIHSSAKR